MAVVLFSLLLFSGFGSRWGSKILPIYTALLVLLVFLTGWLFLIPALLRATLGLPLAARISMSIISVAPIGFLMGFPFPAGLEWMRESLLRDEKNHAEGMVAGPGVVTGRSGSIGSVFFIEDDFWPLNTTLYVKDFHGNDPRFIFYLLKSFNLRRFASGAGCGWRSPI